MISVIHANVFQFVKIKLLIHKCRQNGKDLIAILIKDCSFVYL